MSETKNSNAVSPNLALKKVVWTNTAFDLVLPHIQKLKNETLVEVARRTCNIGIRAFIMNGACFRELCSRVPRLKGGHGKRDTERIGAQFRKREIAKQIGFDVRTLGTNARIYETFYLQSVQKGTLLERERSTPSLPREFYVSALAAPDPLTAVETALARRANGHYSCTQFRAYVHVLKQAAKAGTPVHDKRESRFVSFRLNLPPEAGEVLEAKMTITGKSASEVIAELLLRLGSPRRTIKFKGRANQPSRRRDKAYPNAPTVSSSIPTARSLFDLSDEQEAR
jgi:hypothetical protein